MVKDPSPTDDFTKVRVCYRAWWRYKASGRI